MNILKIKQDNLIKIFDIIALSSWGILFLKYSFTGQLNLLIHPNYFWLVTITGVILIFIAIYKIYEIRKLIKKPQNNSNNEQHLTLFPPGWSSILLIIIAFLALLIPPRILASDTALQRGISESLPLTRIQPQAWNLQTKPEDRSLLEWIKTLNTYPEPDAYIGQNAKVTGFVVKPPNLPANYFLIARFVITCCAVDAYPVGLPVKIKLENQENYPQDTWLEIEGKMISETLILTGDNEDITPKNNSKRKLILEAKTIKKIETPSNPYEY